MPSSGVVRYASIIGTATDSTSRLVTLNGCGFWMTG
jgi:hypothetical protein